MQSINILTASFIIYSIGVTITTAVLLIALRRAATLHEDTTALYRCEQSYVDTLEESLTELRIQLNDAKSRSRSQQTNEDYIKEARMHFASICAGVNELGYEVLLSEEGIMLVPHDGVTDSITISQEVH